VDFTEGNRAMDRVVDIPPYTHGPHLKLLISHFVSTSFGLIIQKTQHE
jgi:hypothetical protein